MANVEDALAARTEIGSDLAAGVNTLSLNQEITFTKYVKVVLPLDGFVFWVKANLLSASAILNASRFAQVAFNQGARLIAAAPTLTVKGSLHYATGLQQNEDEIIAVNSMVFTSLEEVQDFNAVGPDMIYIATVDGLRFAFNQRRSFYRQAGLHHYVGNAVYPAMDTQVVDSPAQFDARQPVVSNSLPLWLALNQYVAPPGSFRCPVALYPSFAVPDNLPPPYGSVHVVPEATQAIAAAPTLGPTLSHDQLCRDQVRVTLYGLRNDAALQFMDCINAYTLDADRFGLMNMPALRDEKRTQSELSILAMKKSAVFEISYLQSASRAIARQVIESCVPGYVVNQL